MLILRPTSQFRKDYKLMKKRGCDMKLLETVVQALLEGKTLDSKYRKLTMDVEVCPLELSKQRGIVLHLPYHGFADKSKIDFAFIHNEMREKIEVLKSYGFVSESDSEYRLTQKGWYWYVDLIFYLSPEGDKQKMLSKIKRIEDKDHAFLGKWGINWAYNG